MTLKVHVHQAEEGGYWAEVPGLPGCVTEGDTLDEVKANLVEAVEGWLLVAQSCEGVSPSTQVFEIAV